MRPNTITFENHGEQKLTSKAANETNYKITSENLGKQKLRISSLFN